MQTAQALLDFDTIAGADKFGNIFVSRLPAGASSEDNPAGATIWDAAQSIGGAAHIPMRSKT